MYADTSPFTYYYLSLIFDVLALRCIERHRQTVAARRSVASRSNVRPRWGAPHMAGTSGKEGRQSAGLPPSLLARGPSHVWSSPACVWRSSGRRWIWRILNVTTHLWWTDIGCKAFKWLYAGRKFVYLLYIEMPPPCRRGVCHFAIASHRYWRQSARTFNVVIDQ